MVHKIDFCNCSTNPRDRPQKSRRKGNKTAPSFCGGTPFSDGPGAKPQTLLLGASVSIRKRNRCRRSSGIASTLSMMECIRLPSSIRPRSAEKVEYKGGRPHGGFCGGHLITP